MSVKERGDIPVQGLLIFINGRVHEVTKAWEGTGPRIGEKCDYYTCHDPGDGLEAGEGWRWSGRVPGNVAHWRGTRGAGRARLGAEAV